MDRPALTPGTPATIGEKYAYAMEITEQAEADSYFEALVQHNMGCAGGRHTRKQAEAIERSNLGYFAGYYSNETRARVERLFATAHPIFGRIADGAPTAKEAFEAGRARAR